MKTFVNFKPFKGLQIVFLISKLFQKSDHGNSEYKEIIISVRLTKSISGLVLKAWKSSSFIDTNMLASMPREVPMPYKI